MQTFLEETLLDINKKYEDLSSITFILPSKRASGFLLNYIKKKSNKTTFAPNIISIEEFIEKLSGYQIIDNTELLFKSYEVYLKIAPEQEKDGFEVYSTWATTLLNDFSEIDRHLINPESFFNYLSSIQDMNHWYLKEEKTALVENYLKFWNSLFEFYNTLKTKLLNSNTGYQGLIYREASENIEHYKINREDTPHVFIGFNALNKAEETIIQEMLENKNTSVYWDVDSYFYNNQKHSASYFVRKYTSEWNYYEKNPLKKTESNYLKPKNIHIVEAQKNIGQTKFISGYLAHLSEKELNKTAIVLADENLLHPLLQSLPKNIAKVNITMGVKLKTFPIVVFFNQILLLHDTTSNSFYYKQILAILHHPITSHLLEDTSVIINHILKENLTHITIEQLLNIAHKEDLDSLQLIFGNWENNSTSAIISLKKILFKLKESEDLDAVEKVVTYQLFQSIITIENLNNEYQYLKTIKTVQQLFSNYISNATLDFKGDAYQGLQIMGVLETRVLDFENLIIASVNEGIFPSGKSNNSFITYDLKQEYKLPTYTEKDAIYTYHFYRLLHRARNITLLYNNFTDALSTGEKSRFISQIEYEKVATHTLKKSIVSPKVPIIKSEVKEINKTEEILIRIKEIAKRGFSPSALTTYIRNPMDFYFQKILKVKEENQVEEVVAANTLGTIVHDTLEAFYKPLKGTFLTVEVLEKMEPLLRKEIEFQFLKSFKGGDFSKGKNLIIFEVANRFVENFINFEIEELKKGNTIKILQIESDLEVNIPIAELDFPIKIHGKVDRVDEYNGQMRIIDYKSGKVDQSNLNLVNWDDVTTDYKKYSKIVQVLAYAFMIYDKTPFISAEAGIISFKNLGGGFLKFSKKDTPNSRNPETTITKEVFDEYLIQLKKLILEICNPNIPFTEKEI